MRTSVALAALLVFAGCVDETAVRRDAAMADCREVADAFASRCPGGDPEEEAVLLSCDHADAIRDRDALFDECIPAIRALPCDSEGPLPAACADQIILFW